jgi:predicted small lipoprotein YifL
MSGVIFNLTGKHCSKICASALWMLAFAALAVSMAAQQEKGPLPPPPPGTVVPSSVPADAARTNASPQVTSPHITNEPPALPVEQIIQKFTQHEDEFRKERENYTYTQIFLFQTIDDDGQVDGEYRMTSDILFTPAGKRYEKVIEAPGSTIQRITMEQQDFDDIEKIWPLVLTPNELPKYDIKYVGREQVDELSTYVFDITPIKLEKNQRYFQGRIWVEDRDMQIVKTHGKGTGLLKKKQDSAYPIFETFRENITGHFWFPTYTRSDDTLHFKTGPDVRIRVAVRYTNYKRFGSTIKIGTATQVDPDKP